MPSTTSAPSNFANKRAAAPVVLAALILIFCVRSYSTFRVFNDTADEAVHIACGLEVWQHGRYTIEAQHPPLARMVMALPAFLAGLRERHPEPLWTGAGRDFYWCTLSLSRLGNLIFAPFLIVYLYLWGRRLYGPAAGLGAAALASFSPNLLAHVSLATLDFGAATAVFVSCYYFWRWSEQPGLRNCVAAAAAFGIAALTKFSAIVFIPPIAVAYFLLARWNKGGRSEPARWYAAARRGVVFLAAFFVVVWAGYLFEVGPLPPAHFVPTAGSFAKRAVQAVEQVVNHRGLPAPRFLRGVLEVAAHNSQGHQCYLLGHLGQLGWWYYFPVALAVKTTIPLLLLVALAAVLRIRTGGQSGTCPALYPLLSAALLLAAAMPSNLNMGIRHVLAIYPFFALAAASLFAGPRWLMSLALALGFWHGAESLIAHPDYLAYFNQIARSREEEFLLDSNLDWGQDLERLRRYLNEKQVKTVYLSYFGRANPSSLLDVREIRPLPPDLRPAGWVAVSRAHIAGMALQGYNLGWLKAYRPVARIGKSILVYYFPG
ncbi:MAG: glycosyltransferase family 39 protein [Acidobacteria bacterium]|nr:glycosyltransferase family 39 protein [Acidobacteriota bacterium]